MINTILESIYKDRRVHDLLSRLKPEHLQDDLLQHCLLYVAEVYKRRPDHITGMYERGELFAWFQRCMKVELTGKNSKFFRLMRRPPESLPDAIGEVVDHEFVDDLEHYRKDADECFGKGYWEAEVKKIEEKRERRAKAIEAAKKAV